MLDELLFFQIRIFRMFCQETKQAPIKANNIFNTYNIWQYLEEAYPVLHLNSDECALEDVLGILKIKGWPL